MKRKDIILAGGLIIPRHPAILPTSKLLPAFDQPMTCYLIGTLIRAGIRDILIIFTLQATRRFEQWGQNLQYIDWPATKQPQLTGKNQASAPLSQTEGFA